VPIPTAIATLCLIALPGGSALALQNALADRELDKSVGTNGAVVRLGRQRTIGLITLLHGLTYSFLLVSAPTTASPVLLAVGGLLLAVGVTLSTRASRFLRQRGWEVSALATMQLADKAARHGIQHFIYASSGSVYGLKDEAQVTEDLTLVPLSEYNKTKMVAERVVLSYSNQMTVQVVRPATVCGISPRMRFDVSVNMLTMQALNRGEITVLGGEQIRPNIHIDDITDLYVFLLNKPDIQGIYNAGFENISIMNIAEMIANHTNATITVKQSNDPRSYRVNSSKLLATGFTPRKRVEDAILEICTAYISGLIKDEDSFYNLKWMQKEVLT
jgi:nucleoside-diphosphate-sugar epimerase